MNSQRRSGYRPDEPIGINPIFMRPWKTGPVLEWIFGFPGYLWPWQTVFAAMAVASYLFLVPDLIRLKEFSVDWIALLFFKNLALLVGFNTLWHAWLYVRKVQGTEYKYNSRWIAESDTSFLFRSQLWDNVFWSVCSAVPIWTAYEAITLWLQAHGVIPTVSWEQRPLYCVALVILTPLWFDLHFYITHRIIHWKSLYRMVHSLHHKNINFGVWSGLAMHPVEHLIYFSGVLLYWIVPAHPVHVVLALQNNALGAALQHHGFARVMLGKQVSYDTDHYMHYLHHKYVAVNFSTGLLPLDKWFGTFHDGSDEAMEAFKRRERERANRARSA